MKRKQEKGITWHSFRSPSSHSWPLRVLLSPRRFPENPFPRRSFLLVLGAVLGPHMLGVIHVDAEVSLVSELGPAFLFLLAGFEIDPKSITGVEGRYGLATWVVTFGIAWLAVRFYPVVLSQSFRRYRRDACPSLRRRSVRFVPIMRERSLTGTRVGDSILAYGTWGELGPVLAMSVLLFARTGIQTLVILGLFAVVCVLLAVVPSRPKRVGSRFFAFVEERADTTSQTFVRLTVLIPVTLVAFSAVFDLDIVLGSLPPALSCAISSPRATIRSRPSSTVWPTVFDSGVLYRIGRKDRSDGRGVAPGSARGLYRGVVDYSCRAHSYFHEHLSCDARVSAYGRITVAPVLHHGAADHRCRDERCRQRGRAVARRRIGYGRCRRHHGVLDAAARAALLPRGRCSAGHRRGRGCRASIRCARHLARPSRFGELLLAREHELLTSHGHGRSLDGIPTLDSIADRLSTEAASGHIDARIVDAAHLLAEKTYGDEIDPSKLTPRERRRWSAPSSPCTNTAAACWSSTARDEARDDDGK